MSARISLRGILMLIQDDNLRRIYNVGFIVEQLIINYAIYFGLTYVHSIISTFRALILPPNNDVSPSIGVLGHYRQGL